MNNDDIPPWATLVDISGKIPVWQGDQALGCIYVGILETPCHPCRYYAGVLQRAVHGWIPKSNETHLFHRTVEEAIDAADLVLKTLQIPENKTST